MNIKRKILSILVVMLAIVSMTACQINNKTSEQSEKAEATEKDLAESESTEIKTSENEKLAQTETSEESESSEIDGQKNINNTDALRIGAMTGPTGIGVINQINSSEDGLSNYPYNLTIVSSPDELVTGIAKKDLDLAIVPANLASILANKPEMGIQVLSTNNLGVVYVLERGDSVESLEDLQGKEVLSAGKGATPEILVRNLAAKVELDVDSSISFSKEASEVAQAMISGNSDIVILPEPMVTNVLLKDDSVRIAIDLNDEWNKLNPDSKLITSVLIGRKEILDTIDVNLLLEDYSNSIESANNDPAGTTKVLDGFDIMPFPAEVIEESIPKLNLTAIQGDELKQALNGYLSILHEQNPESIGGELPGDDFYR